MTTEDRKDNVVALPAFQEKTGKTVAEKLGVEGIIMSFNPEFANLELPDPRPGELVIGTLVDEEVGLYVEYHKLFVELDDLIRGINSDLLSEAATHIRTGSNDLSHIQSAVEELVDETTADRLCRLQRRLDMVKTTLFYSIAERLNAHRHVLGVRSGGRITRPATGHHHGHRY